jgi:hypothetical protein
MNHNQVIGTEMAKGTIDGTGLMSTGNEGGARYERKYTGALAADGGDLHGHAVLDAGRRDPHPNLHKGVCKGAPRKRGCANADSLTPRAGKPHLKARGACAQPLVRS